MSVMGLLSVILCDDPTNRIRKKKERGTKELKRKENE